MEEPQLVLRDLNINLCHFNEFSRGKKLTFNEILMDKYCSFWWNLDGYCEDDDEFWGYHAIVCFLMSLGGLESSIFLSGFWWLKSFKSITRLPNSRATN